MPHDVLLELAGKRCFERGEGYHRGGHVGGIVEHEGTIAAKVLGTYEYRVRLRAEDDELDYSCDCPLGVDGEFCKHCVAVGLDWLEGEVGHKLSEAGAEPITMDDVRTYLERQEKDVLVRIVIEQAMEDERLRERLLLRAARTGGGSPDIAAFRWAIDRAVEPPDDYWDYSSPWDYARGLESVIEAISEMLKEGFAAEAIELSEYALAEVEKKAMDYDADGTIHGILEDIEEIHHAACVEAQPDPEALAARLFVWEMGGHYDTFYGAVETYADVLGEKGLAEYRRLAEEEWAKVSTLGPDRERAWHYDRRRTRLTNIMRALAGLSGDIEELVAVESKDLSRPQAYLRIAEIYHDAGDADKALEWAEEGMWVFPDEKRSGLRGFVAERYHERGRHEKAMELAWARFVESPNLEGYKQLKDHADRAGGWRTWREKALAFVREDVAKRKEESVRSYLSFPVDHSELVRILLWEGRDEDAWREAKEGGCSNELWLELAAGREEDHPEDALSVYEARIEPLIERTDNKAYQEAYELLLKMRALMRRLGREQELDEYLELLRIEYKRKRNFMKLLDRIR